MVEGKSLAVLRPMWREMYPTCYVAVDMCECAVTDKAWGELKERCEGSFEKGRDLLLYAVADTVAQAGEFQHGKLSVRDKVYMTLIAAGQMYTDEFRAYLCAKLGIRE